MKPTDPNKAFKFSVRSETSLNSNKFLRGCGMLEAQSQQTRTLGAHLLASTLNHVLAA
jgi:hypothetical protein